MIFLGLRSVIYPAPDLWTSRAWFTRLLGTEPYFDEDFYVGFSVNGFELGLDPNADPAAGAVSFWGVADAHTALATLLRAGAAGDGVREVGGGIRMATVREPGGQLLGIIENPHFTSTASAAHEE